MFLFNKFNCVFNNEKQIFSNTFISKFIFIYPKIMVLRQVYIQSNLFLEEIFVSLINSIQSKVICFRYANEGIMSFKGESRVLYKD